LTAPEKSKKPQIYSFDKITAAMRQLDTAVYLFVSRTEDPISPAVLAASAWSIVKDILGNDERSVRYQFGLTGNYSYAELDEFWNFCKHAKSDPNHKMQFPEGYIEQLLFCAIHDFSLLHDPSQLMGDFYYPHAKKLLV
jgi:hypothetical protein